MPEVQIERRADMRELVQRVTDHEAQDDARHTETMTAIGQLTGRVDTLLGLLAGPSLAARALDGAIAFSRHPNAKWLALVLVTALVLVYGATATWGDLTIGPRSDPPALTTTATEAP